MIPNMWHSGKGNTIETVKRAEVSRGWEQWGMNGRSTEYLRGSENSLCGTIMMHTCHYKFT